MFLSNFCKLTVQVHPPGFLFGGGQMRICYRHLTQARKSKKLFKVIDGKIDTATSAYAQNSAHNEELQQKYNMFMGLISAGGGEKATIRHTEQNKKVLPADRLKMLFDDADDVLEIGNFAGMGQKYGNVPRAGSITVIGKVNGVYCVALANDATIKGGTIFPIGVKKQLRLNDVTIENHLPAIYIVDSGGAFLPLQAEIFTPGGKMFRNEAIMNSKNIPQLAIVCGSCTAGAAYVPTMAQEALIVHKIGTIFLGGPPLVYAALREKVSPEDLGGGLMHSSVSGCTDHYTTTEEDAFETSRDIVATFNIQPVEYSSDYDEPLFDSSELFGLIPKDNQYTMDMYKVIARIVDGSRLQEFKTLYGPTLVTGFAFIQGHLVGIVGSNGEMTAHAAEKGAHFVQMCSQRDVPLIFLQNTTPSNHMANTVEEAASQGNMIRAHAKLMASVACATVPKLTIIVGDSIGADNFMMCGRSMDPRFIFSWPNARTCIAEPEMLIEQAIMAKFPDPATHSTPEYKEYADKVKEQMTLVSSSFNSSGQLWDDGIIQPQDTRKVLGKCLEIVKQANHLPQGDVDYGVIRM